MIYYKLTVNEQGLVVRIESSDTPSIEFKRYAKEQIDSIKLKYTHIDTLTPIIDEVITNDN